MERTPLLTRLAVAFLAGIAALTVASAFGIFTQPAAMIAILGAVALAGLRPQRQRQAITIPAKTFPPRRR